MLHKITKILQVIELIKQMSFLKIKQIRHLLEEIKQEIPLIKPLITIQRLHPTLLLLPIELMCPQQLTKQYCQGYKVVSIIQTRLPTKRIKQAIKQAIIQVNKSTRPILYLIT